MSDPNPLLLLAQWREAVREAAAAGGTTARAMDLTPAVHVAHYALTQLDPIALRALAAQHEQMRDALTELVRLRADKDSGEPALLRRHDERKAAAWRRARAALAGEEEA